MWWLARVSARERGGSDGGWLWPECRPEGEERKGGGAIEESGAPERGQSRWGSRGEVRFRSRGRYPLSRFLTILFLMVFFSGLVLASGAGEAYVAIVVAASLPPLFLFALSPLLTAHTVSPAGLTVRQGWYFSVFLPASSISEAGATDEEVPPKSISFSPRRSTLYVTLSSFPLVYVELREPVPLPSSSGRPVKRVVLSVDEPERMLDALGRLAGVRIAEERRCPECLRPLESAPRPSGLSPCGRRVPTRFEHIFLIHQDGRLVYQYTGGSMRPLSSSSVSGMLLVIQDFIRDAFKTEGGALRRLEHGELNVLIEAGRSLYLAVTFPSGETEPPGLRETMRRVLREIEAEYGEALANWDGREPDGIGKVVSQILWE
ncbi:MAG: hypothetical protein QW379_03710 [Thermoplasmata archaeon]